MSGPVDPSGILFATYVNKKSDSLSPSEPVELKGVVQNLNTITKQFTIHSVTIDYTSATASDFPGPEPQQGKIAEIDGRLIDPGILPATSVVFENGLGRDE